jgi:hypothetical protein
MHLTSKTPAVEAGASRKRCGGCFREPSTAMGMQAQFRIGAHHVRPECAATVATLTFGGGAQ